MKALMCGNCRHFRLLPPEAQHMQKDDKGRLVPILGAAKRGLCVVNPVSLAVVGVTAEGRPHFEGIYPPTWETMMGCGKHEMMEETQGAIREAV